MHMPSTYKHLCLFLIAFITLLIVPLTTYADTDILLPTPTPATLKNLEQSLPMNSCSLVAIKGHQFLPDSSLIVNMYAVTGKGKHVGHSVLWIPMDTGFFIYQANGSRWFEGKLQGYNGQVALYSIMLDVIEKTDYIRGMAVQVVY